MGYLYKMLAEAIAKWPVDELKLKSRNLHNYLKTDLEKAFTIDKKTAEREPPEGKKHEYARHLKGIQALLNNEALRQYPNDKYRTGHMGLTLEQLQRLNSDDGRKQIGFHRRNVEKKSWRNWFSR